MSTVIPTSWKDVSLWQYIELETLPKYDTENEEEILKRKITEAYILTGLSVEEIDKLPFGELYKIKYLLEGTKPQRLRKSFKYNGVRYRVQLNPLKLDSDKFISILNLSRKDPIKRMPQILLNICRPYKRTLFGRRYYEFTAEEYKEKVKEFRNISMKIANPILVFFYTLSENLLKATQRYSDNQMEKNMKRIKEVERQLLKMK